MLGVNGISMSGLAEILLSRGVRLSGSDLTHSDRTERLKELGAVIYRGNAADHIDGGDPPDLLVYTAAAGPDNPERARAAELGIKSVDRAELLGAIMAAHKTSIAVAGTHGKTTTSAMIAAILLAAGFDPTINIGGEFAMIGGTSRIGGNEMFLAEACEYVDSSLKLHPTIGVITNIEYDHTDYFRDIEQLRASFARYAGQSGVFTVVNADDANVTAIRAGWVANRTGEPDDPGRGAAPASGEGPEWLLFGIESADADVKATDISYDDAGNGTFTLVSGAHDRSVRVRLRVPGPHNVYNALAAAAASVAAGCTFEAAAAGLELFGGVGKRFEYKGRVEGYDIVDDYAHHPTAVGLALGTARKYARGGRVLCVFHPHTYTRTRTFLAEFAEAFLAADQVLLADIFPAREADPGDISSAMLADRINKLGGRAAYFGGGFPAIAEWVRANAKPGDIVLTMGAGHSSDVADILLGGKKC